MHFFQFLILSRCDIFVYFFKVVEVRLLVKKRLVVMTTTMWMMAKVKLRAQYQDILFTTSY
jgi:hypothetical protein